MCGAESSKEEKDKKEKKKKKAQGRSASQGCRGTTEIFRNATSPGSGAAVAQNEVM